MGTPLSFFLDGGGIRHGYAAAVPIEIEIDGTYHPYHTWQSGYIYTYYLILGGIGDKLELSFTCTLTPWEYVNGSLSTDLEH